MTRRVKATSGRTRVLGIDPGTRVLGYGILDVAKGHPPLLVDCGALRLPSRPLADRLELVFEEVRGLIRKHRPRVLAIEDVFGGKNIQSVLKVGEARGVVVLAGQMAGLAIAEYAPAMVKRTATGNGNADKTQVQRMMERLLEVEELPGPADVTDALAVAFCHGQRMWKESLTDAARTGRSATRRRAEGGVRTKSAGATGETATSRAQSLRKAASGKTTPGTKGDADARGKAALDALLKNGKARAFVGSRFRKTARKGKGKKR